MRQAICCLLHKIFFQIFVLLRKASHNVNIGIILAHQELERVADKYMTVTLVIISVFLSCWFRIKDTNEL